MTTVLGSGRVVTVSKCICFRLPISQASYNMWLGFLPRLGWKFCCLGQCENKYGNQIHNYYISACLLLQPSYVVKLIQIMSYGSTHSSCFGIISKL
jgi:hypothetical protein